MWVFGYGSLLFDAWESDFECTHRVLATLKQHRRSFNKASQKRWGSKANPGPTLNLLRDDEMSCQGIAFAFPNTKETEVRSYLCKREGKSFGLCEYRIHLVNGDPVQAIIPVYSGANLLDHKSLVERARMVLAAKGTAGRCYDYVKQIVYKLAELKIDDPDVKEFWQAVESTNKASR